MTMAGRLFAIGDIHGCARELEALLAGLRPARGDTLLFVGDYIDRGPASRAVIDQLLDVERRTDVASVFLRGNHEDMCLSFLGRPGSWGESWFVNGGAATLRSYGIDARSTPAVAEEALPAAHLRFFEHLQSLHVVGDYLFAHAGIRPDRPLAEQEDDDLLWIREEFINAPHSLPYTVVFGHTPQRNVLVQLPYRIGIDTGCVYGGRLTALELPAGVVHQVAWGEREVRRTQLPMHDVPVRAKA